MAKAPPRQRTPEQRAKQAAYMKAWRAKQTPEWHAAANARIREWCAAHPLATARASLKHMRKRNGVVNPTGETRVGPCDICTLPSGELHLDHDHLTGLARGWLCHGCNVALGMFKDSPLVLRAAQHYLESRAAVAAE